MKRPTAPLLYGHRGASAEWPENTLPAFERAVEVGVDVVESDVHLTLDGVVVMAHDEDGRRMAGTPERIRDLRFDEVLQWDVGFGFVDDDGLRPHAGRGLCVPKLEDVLRAFPDMCFNLDVKQEAPPMVDALMDVLRRCNAMDRVTLASFSTLNMRRIRAVFGGPTVMGRNDIIALYALPQLALRALAVLPSGARAQVPERAGPLAFDTPRFINRAHDLGIPVEFWTINDPERAKRLLDLGADGIMTDDPFRVKQAFA